MKVLAEYQRGGAGYQSRQGGVENGSRQEGGGNSEGWELAQDREDSSWLIRGWSQYQTGLVVSGGRGMNEVVRAYRVRTRSSGARSRPAIAAEATAMANEASGEGLSATSRAPIAPATTSLALPARAAGSGRFKRAESKLLVQLSTALDRTLRMKVELVAFHRPVAPECCHSWARVSIMESGRRRTSL